MTEIFDDQIRADATAEPGTFRLGDVVFHVEGDLPFGAVLLLQLESDTQAQIQAIARLLLQWVRPSQARALKTQIGKLTSFSPLSDALDEALKADTGRPI